MIDIIIPTFNAIDTIFDTLLSISMQNKKQYLNVYIIDDASNCDYSNVINKFKDIINIQYFKLKENVGSGLARQYGIDSSNSEYFMFIDADDILPNCEVIDLILEKIKLKPDLIIGNIFDEKKQTLFKNHDGCLHGKCYRRDFVENKKIIFSNRRIHEDNEFHKKVIMNNPNTKFINELIYIYKYNISSLTNNNANYNDEYISMIIDVVAYAERNSISYNIINKFLQQRKEYLENLNIKLECYDELLKILSKYNIKTNDK